jgi:phenylalanyl-tRNA synthetase alpha chain
MDHEKTIKELSQNEKKVLLTLNKLKGKAKPEKIQKTGDFTQEVEVMNASSWLQSKKLVKIKDQLKTEYRLKKEGKEFLKSGLPEKRALKIIDKLDGKASIKDLSSDLKKNDIPVAIGWLKRKKWADIKKDGKDTILSITKEGKEALKTKTFDEKILEKIDKLDGIEIDKKLIKPLLSRKNVIKEKEIITSNIILTDEGKKVIKKGIKFKDEISQITSSVIKSGEWKKKDIRPYDIFAFSPKKYGGKIHPLTNLINNIKKIFFEMGFEEIKGNYIESRI